MNNERLTVTRAICRGRVHVINFDYDAFIGLGELGLHERLVIWHDKLGREKTVIKMNVNIKNRFGVSS